MPTDRNLNSFTTLTPPGTKPVVNSIMKDFSAEALAELRLWLEQNPPAVPITSVLGFSQFTAQQAAVGTSETTTSASFTDLTTVGPSLTGLPNGKYLVLFGCVASAAANSAEMGINVNSGGVDNTQVALTQSTALTGITRGATFTLNGGGNNTVLAQYSSDGTHTATFTQRWLVAIRYSNL